MEVYDTNKDEDGKTEELSEGEGLLVWTLISFCCLIVGLAVYSLFW